MTPPRRPTCGKTVAPGAVCEACPFVRRGGRIAGP
jgi:hypothetical protein